ncbi:hypothetical protein GGP77_001839, partial [Salinibacter ruber]|nr:hypothetical protein [Salinibacter ruber]
METTQVRLLRNAMSAYAQRRRAASSNLANGVCKFSIDQFGKLQWRMSVPIAQQHRHR